MVELKFDTNNNIPICLALGFFDSVHKGHRSILNRVINAANSRGTKSAVFTFDNNMYKVFDKDSREVYTYNERLEIFKSIGIDCVLHASFDENFKHLDSDSFLNRLFTNNIIDTVFCGTDYRFGRGRSGNINLLQSYCNKIGTEMEIVSDVTFRGKRISTTSIKEHLSNGNIEFANELLGQNYFLKGKVIHGRNIGHLYGIPTANTEFSQDKYLPRYGVYGTYVYVDGKQHIAVTNIGSKPTFSESGVSVESMINDIDTDLYGKTITIEFVKQLRDIKKFDTPEMLAKQVHDDINWRH